MPHDKPRLKGSTKIVVANSLTVHGNLNLGHDSDGEQHVPLTFSRLRMESSRWKTTKKPIPGHFMTYPFDTAASQYFYLSEDEHEDPLFDVIARNNLDCPVVVLAVGVVLEQVADKAYGFTGLPPKFFRVTRDDILEIQIPEIRQSWPQLPEVDPPNNGEVEIEKKDLLISLDLEDPIGIEAKQTYRFGLYLKNYIHGMPNNVLCRIAIDTDSGRVSSDLLYLSTY
jgi:hypothetical protein